MAEDTFRRYYSFRNKTNSIPSPLDFLSLKRLFNIIYLMFLENDYFQEAYGYKCVDAGSVPGKLGYKIDAQFLRKLRKLDLWPIHERYWFYSESDLFDVIEFLYDNISKPIDGNYHESSSCGWHYHSFDKKSGQEEFRQEINEILFDYKDSFELSDSGEILALADKGLENLFQATVPTNDPANIEARVNAAVQKFRRHKSSIDERRDAVRDLADVLEFLQPKLKLVITKSDEKDLFNIANNFGIRHHNETQKTDYEKAIWYRWMFYYYLATIHAALGLIQKHEEESSNKSS